MSGSIFKLRMFMVGLAAVLLSPVSAQIPEQYPKPLLHTPEDHPAQRVVLIVVDGLGALDLADFVSSHQQSALADLSRRGVTYTNAHVPWPDPSAALLTLVSGGSPISTGIFSSHGYDRAVQAGGDHCPVRGSALDLADGTPTVAPASDLCRPVLAHELVRVNSIFDLVHNAGGHTAWAGDNAAYADLLRGPSGKALDDVFTAGPSLSSTGDVASAKLLDKSCVDALVGWLGRGTRAPRLAGIDLTTLDAAHRSSAMVRNMDVAPVGAFGPSPLEFVDGEVASIVAALKAAGLYDETWVVITSPFATHADRANLRVINAERVEQAAYSSAPTEVDRVAVGTAAMLWLRNAKDTAAVVRAYRIKMNELGIGKIYFGPELGLVLKTSAEDTRMPDVVLEPQAGVKWSRNHRWPAPLGGFGDDDNHVAMLISGRQLTGREDKTPVPTGQVAPLIVRMLGMEKFGLDALHQEHVPALPGIF